MRYEFLVRRGSISLGRRFAPRIDDLPQNGRLSLWVVMAMADSRFLTAEALRNDKKF